MSLKRLEKNTVLKGKGFFFPFLKDWCKWFTLKISILNHFDLSCPKDAN